ncbi:MAG: glycosyltransferase [[Ruminococcus] lactaris]|uniref:glycosyltransferase n=1 Tax=[Ruminococcus] lactaris TaxID=46228 RepID=UPI00290B8D10|nr:glycosyltransferase [[Ruminococcus] lactaris]MDU6469419.1 glycosyltransferase [[Ruminococcus] lactaris]
MKDKLSKVKNLVKKYGLTGTIKKMTGYIYSNYIVRISMKEKIYVALNKKEIRKRLKRMLEREDYDRIVVWRSSFGWDVPLYQRPQHIFTNFAKQRTLVLYEVTRFTDDVKRIKRQSENLYLVNFMNKAFANYIFEAIEQQEKPRYVQFYSTDWTLTKGQIEEYERRGYKVVYEYIDDLNPHLAGTDELPVNVREKYEKTMKEKDSIVVVTADALQRDVLSKRGDSHLVFSCNGVDYNHFHNEIDPDFKFEKEFAEILEKGQPMIGYYGALAKWFDYQLVKELAETGKYQIVLFGIKYDDSYEKAGLDRQENVHFLGSRDYHVLQNYAAKMDVLTIPFLINEITKATSPVKLFEYMALNKPIVTTDMDECRKYQSVLIGHDHKEFEAKLDEALEKRSDKAYIELLDREALENTWEEKAKAIIEEMKHCEEADGNR